MGGLTTNGLGDNAQQFPPDELQFAALRCGVDALNGDNVEWVGYRNGAKHTFCYAIYIHDGPPPPTPGQITIRKSAVGGGDQSFGFTGDISFNPGGKFSLKDGGVFSETRAPGQWYVEEDDLPAGWEFSGIYCSSVTGGASVAGVGRRLTIFLTAGGSVDCTFANRPLPPPKRLVINKVTYGKTGSFGFDVTGPGGYTGDATLVTTSDQGEDPASAAFEPVPAGEYTMTETLPTDPEGTWEVTDVECIDENRNPLQVTGSGATRAVTLALNQEASCTWTNTFTPRASLIIRAKTIGGTSDNIEYVDLVWDPIEGTCDFPAYLQEADTTVSGEGVFATATGGSTLEQVVQTYCIGGLKPGGPSPDKAWATKLVECTGDIDYTRPFNTDFAFDTAIVSPVPGGTVTCDFVYVKRASLDVVKQVTAGNDLRAGPVVLDVNCVASAEADPAVWPKQVTLPTGQTTASLKEQAGGTVYVDGDPEGKDNCSVTESSTGQPLGPQGGATIAPKWNGADWPSGTKALTFDKTASVAGASASNGSAVDLALTSGPCTLKGTTLKAESGTGECLLTYQADDNPGATWVATKWSISSPALSGQGVATGSFEVVPGKDTTVDFEDAYTRSSGKVTTQRTVQLNKVSPVEVCKTTKPKRAGSTAVVDCGTKTPEGQKIRYSATCTPIKSAAQGERKFCTVRVTKKGKVIVRTYGQPVRVRVTATAKATKDAKAWRKTWSWRVP